MPRSSSYISARPKTVSGRRCGATRASDMGRDVIWLRTTIINHTTGPLHFMPCAARVLRRDDLSQLGLLIHFMDFQVQFWSHLNLISHTPQITICVSLMLRIRVFDLSSAANEA